MWQGSFDDIDSPDDLPGSAGATGTMTLEITQRDDLTATQQKKLVARWCEVLPTLDYVTRVEFISRVNQQMFEAACLMPKLRELVIKWSGITDLAPLAELGTLELFDLGTSGSVRDIASLAELTSITDLSLEGLSKITDFAVVGELTTLRRLAICGAIGSVQKVETLAPLANLTRLEELSLIGARVLDGSLDPLLSLHELRRFDSAWYLPDSEFEKVRTLPKLVRGNVITERRPR